MDTLELADGRLLAFDTGPGDATLPTVVAHHGTPGAGTRDRHLDAAAAAAGLRIVTFSRPGYGGSSRRPGRDVADVADDVAALLDHLELDRCATIGASGGGPHALACAALMPERITGVVCVAGVGPWDAPGLDFLAGMGEDNIEEFGLALEGEPVLRPWMEGYTEGLRSATPAQVVDSMTSLLPEVDRQAILGVQGAWLGEDLAASFAEALRVGVDGWVDDDLAFTRPWGFDLAAVGVPAFVWQGDADLMVPAAHGRWLAEHVAGASTHLLPGEGHVSLALGHAATMLEQLAVTLRP